MKSKCICITMPPNIVLTKLRSKNFIIKSVNNCKHTIQTIILINFVNTRSPSFPKKIDKK